MKKVPVEVVAAVIRSENRVLLASRPVDKPPFGWEFPGGKVEPGESRAAALRREMREELAVEVEVGDSLYLLRTAKVRIWFMRAWLRPGNTPSPREGQQWKWVELVPAPPDDLLPTDREFWQFLTF